VIIEFLKSALGIQQPAMVSDTSPLPVRVYDAGGAGIGYSRDYEAVAASSNNRTLGSTGAVGDYLAGVLLIPATTSPGAVSIKDGSGNSITIFAGGDASVADLRSWYVPVGAKSTSGGWVVNVGANISLIGFGMFT
jgi:hypothetical protein